MTDGKSKYYALWAKTGNDYNPDVSQEYGEKRKLWGAKEVFITFIFFLFMQAFVIFLTVLGKIFVDREAFMLTEDRERYILETLANLGTSPSLILASSFAMYFAWYLGMRLTTNTLGSKNFIEDFGVKFKRSDIYWGIALATVFRLLEWGTLTLLPRLGLDMTGAGNSAVVTSMTGVWWFLNAVLVASFIAPIMEELFFRGFMLRGIQNSIYRLASNKNNAKTDFSQIHEVIPSPTILTMEYKVEKTIVNMEKILSKSAVVISILVSSVVFGFMHYQGTETFGQIFVVIWTGLLGLVMAIMAQVTGRLGLAIFFHIAYNFSAILLSLL